MTRAKELLEQATPLPWEWLQYAHGGGRVSRGNDLILDVYHAGDYALLHEAVNRLPDYEAAVEALERLVEASERLDYTAKREAIEHANAALRCLREEGPA